MQRIFLKVSRDLLPKIRDKYPFIYLEHGRLEIDDSSVKWIDEIGHVIHLPIATINTLLLGPGTSITHAAIKSISEANCTICWVGSDSLLYYATGETPTSNTYNLKHQLSYASNGRKKLEVARRMFSYRINDVDLSNKSLHEMMGIEGVRVKKLYQESAEKYNITWDGRDYVPGKINLSNTTNKILTCCNSALYGIILSVTHSLGLSPKIGFIHSGCPLPFIYDIADIYKPEVSIDLAFKLTRDMCGEYQKDTVAEAFKERIIKNQIIERAVKDIYSILELKDGSSNS